MISVVVLTKNNEETLFKTLESLKSFAEVLIVDTGSCDQTVPIATRYSNVKICHLPFISFGAIRNQAATLASNDWICAIDSDEELSPGLIEEIHNTLLQDDTIYAFCRHNFYRNKVIRFAGWHPDFVFRLYHRKKCTFDDAHVHEGLRKEDKKIHYFRSPLYHTPYRSLEDFLEKMQLYSSLFAKQNAHKKPSSIAKALLHGFFAFFKSYFLQRGFLEGVEGFIIATYNGQTAFYKYLKLWECNQKETD